MKKKRKRKKSRTSKKSQAKIRVKRAVVTYRKKRPLRKRKFPKYKQQKLTQILRKNSSDQLFSVIIFFILSLTENILIVLNKE